MKFNDLNLARGFKNRTTKASAIIMGDDQKYWVVSLREIERLLKAGYELIEE